MYVRSTATWFLLLIIGFPVAVHADVLELGVARVPPGVAGTADLILTGDVSQTILGYSLGVEIPAPLTFVSFVPNPALSGPGEFVGIQTGPAFVGIGVVFSTSSLVTPGPGLLELGTLRVNVPALLAGDAIELPIVSGQGSPPISVELATPAGAVFPTSLSGVVFGASAPVSQIWVATLSSFVDDAVTAVTPAGVIGPTYLDGNLHAPTGVAVDPLGIAWVAFRASGVIQRVDSAGLGLGLIVSGVEPGAIAISSRGRAWIANIVDETLSVADPFGRLLFGGDGLLNSPDDGIFGPAIALGAPPVSLAADAVGSMWVAASNGMNSFLYRINRSGEIAVIVDYSGADSSAVSADREGIAWVCLSIAGQVDRVASDGSLIQSFSVTDPSSIAVRRRPGTDGLREAWVVGGTPASPTLYRLRPGPTPTADLFPLPVIAGGDVTGIVIDGTGAPWISRANGTVGSVDPDATPGTNPLTGVTATIGPDALVLGDTSAYTQAFSQFPTATSKLRSFPDFDSDGYINEIELGAGTDVFDALDNPSATIPILPVNGLNCVNDQASVTLSWSIPSDVNPSLLGVQTYTSIEVRVDTVPTLTQPLATDEIFSFSLPGPGTYSVEVIGAFGPTLSPPVTCSITVGTGDLLRSEEVVLDGNLLSPFDVATGPLAATTFGPTNPAALYVTAPQGRLLLVLNSERIVLFSVSTDIFNGDFGATGCSFVANPGAGGLPRLYVVGGADGQQIEVRAFEVLSNGDLQLLVTPHLFMTRVGGNPVTGRPGGMGAQASTSGIGDILLFAGPDGCELLATLSSSSGLVSQGASFIHPTASAASYGLNGVALVDEYGPNGGSAWISALGAVEGEFAAIQVDVAGGVATPTSLSLSFAVLDQENVLGGFDFAGSDEAQAVVLEVIGITTSSVNQVETSSFFVRGDTNDSGSINIADAVASLGILFQGVPPMVCDAALDINADGVVNIADPIYLLTYLFSSGPAPPAPFPNPGGGPFECVAP